MAKIGLNVKLLTGSTKVAERRVIDSQLRDGTLHILVGTHAVLEDKVEFAHLGLAVIDEQHRFGVAQRARLWAKSAVPPHVLVMTATPIPRTLAMTVYGDLDVSVIDELPPGRKPVATVLRYDDQRAKVRAAVRRQLDAGHQVYIVYPLVKENEKLDLRSVEEGFAQAEQTYAPYKVALVHGQLKPAIKDEQMERFVSGEAEEFVARRAFSPWCRQELLRPYEQAPDRCRYPQTPRNHDFDDRWLCNRRGRYADARPGGYRGDGAEWLAFRPEDSQSCPRRPNHTACASCGRGFA